jgi:uncharacterized membrane protein YfcA
VGYWHYILFAAVGVIAGFINVMAGGGSLLTMPVMISCGMDPTVANGSNRVAILAQNISASAGFFRKGLSDIRLSLSLAACTLPGALAGAYAGVKIDDLWFKRILACLMVGILLLMLRRKKSPAAVSSDYAPTRTRMITAHLLMLVAGAYGGFIQAGVGFIFMAILHKVLRLDLVRVNMHKVFIIGVYTIVALAIFVYNGQVNWIAGGSLAVGNAAGGWFGSHFAVKRGEKLIRTVLYIALIVLAVKLVIPEGFFTELFNRLFS